MALQLKTIPGLLEFLQGRGLLTAEVASGLAAEFRDKDVDTLEQALINRKLVSEESLAQAKAASLGLEFVELIGRKIDLEALNVIPRSVSENYKVIAYAQEGTKVSVAFVDPLNAQAGEAIGFLMAERNLVPVQAVTTMASFNDAFKQYAVLKKEVAAVLQTAEQEKKEEREETAAELVTEETIKGAPVSRIVSVIMRYAVESKASDVHIEPWGKDTRVRYRVDGVLRTLLTLPSYLHASIISRIKVLSVMKLDEARIPQDGRITQVINGRSIDFRVSTLPLINAEKVVMRVLDTSTGVPTLDQLGFREKYRAAIVKEIRKPHGMLLITGPTGSGKSTTLFTALAMINGEGLNISTLEDPVEYFLPGANQAQVRPEIGFTFASGLRALLRQDPNVIMVGEIRDQETAELAIHASLTGQLILSTVHTNDAIGVIPRLMDMGVEPFLLSATLNLIIAQRLARRICEHCKEPTDLPDDLQKMMHEELKDIPADYLPKDFKLPVALMAYKGKGCIRCNDTGYTGRTVIAEMMSVTPEIQRLINDKFPVPQVQAEVKRQGWISLRQDGVLKVMEGLTTMDEVLRLSRE